MRCKRRLLSTKNSLKSAKVPLRALSTTLDGTGGRAGESISGEARRALGSASGSGVDSRVTRDGRCGLAVDAMVEELVNGAAVGPDPGRWRDEDRSGMLAIEAAAGRDEATVDALLPVWHWGE